MNSSVQRDRPLVFDLPHLSGLGGAVLPFRASTQRFDSPYRSSRHSERHNQMHSCVAPRNWANSLLNRRRARFFTAGRPSIRSLAVSPPSASLRMTLYSATSCPPVHAGNKFRCWRAPLAARKAANTASTTRFSSGLRARFRFSDNRRIVWSMASTFWELAGRKNELFHDRPPRIGMTGPAGRPARIGSALRKPGSLEGPGELATCHNA